MAFNQWVEAMGFDPESLTEVQRQRLQDKFAAEIKASDNEEGIKASGFDSEDIKAAASEVIIEAGGTITHHHAVGRDHRPWYDRQRPEPFAAALAAAKSAVDPDWMLNPGVLIDPPGQVGR